MLVFPAIPCTGLPAPTPDDVAYLIYTSGTTESPRAWPSTHHNVTQLLGSLGQPILPTSGVWTQCHILRVRHFGVGDLGCAATWWAAGGGARRAGSLAGRLPRLAGRENASMCSPRPPRRSRRFHREGLESVALVVGGEACPAELVDRWAPGRIMVNAYGPTETTMGVTLTAPLMAGSQAWGCRSARRFREQRCLCWTAGYAQFRPVWSGSCMWPVPVWRAGMCAGRG